MDPLAATSSTLKGLILNQRPNDADRRRPRHFYANVDIAGPGWLEIIAGRNLTQEDRGRLGSVGLIDGKPATGKAAPASSSASAARATTPPSPGAISTPATAPTPARPWPASPARPSNERELTDWLRALQGYDGPADQARAYFDALPPEQQRIFLRQVYYAELTQGGRE